jgi:hypothetical protein
METVTLDDIWRTPDEEVAEMLKKYDLSLFGDIRVTLAQMYRDTGQLVSYDVKKLETNTADQLAVKMELSKYFNELGLVDMIHSMYMRKMFGGTKDGFIEVWGLDRLRHIHTFKPFVGRSRIEGLLVYENRLYSHSYKTVSVWSVDTYKHIKNFVFNDIVSKLVVDANKLYVANGNHISVVDLTTNILIALLSSNDPVKDMLVNGDKVYACSGSKITVWSTEPYQKVKILECGVSISCFTVENDVYYIGVRGNVGILTGLALVWLDPPGSGGNSKGIQKVGNRLFVGRGENVNVYNIDTQQIITTVGIHNTIRNLIIADGKIIISCSISTSIYDLNDYHQLRRPTRTDFISLAVY